MKKSFDTNVSKNDCISFLMSHIIRGGQVWEPRRDNVPRWMGNKVLKFPEDLVLYQQVIYKHRPDLLIEVGN